MCIFIEYFLCRKFRRYVFKGKLIFWKNIGFLFFGFLKLMIFYIRYFWVFRSIFIRLKCCGIIYYYLEFRSKCYFFILLIF